MTHHRASRAVGSHGLQRLEDAEAKAYRQGSIDQRKKKREIGRGIDRPREQRVDAETIVRA